MLVRPKSKKKGLEGDGLLNTVLDYAQSVNIIERLSKQTGSIAATAMSLHKPITKTEANNKKKLETWIKGYPGQQLKLLKTRVIKLCFY